MTSTELATVHHGNGLALQSDQDWWNDKQLAALRQIGVDRASNGDLAVFMHVCQRTGLDPFARQIYMILRDGKQVIQTGIDGMRLVARRAVDRNGEVLSISAPEWCGEDGVWRDVWLSDRYPAAARVTVSRGGGTFSAVALWREYVQYKRDGEITRMWATRSAGQLAKCAEALALRKACPQDLAGIYSEDELPRDQHVQRRGGLAAALAETPELSGPGVTPDAPSSSEEHTPGPESVLLVAASPIAKAMHATFNDAGITDREGRLRYTSDVLGRQVASSKEITEAEASRVIDALKADLEQPFPAEDGGS